MEILNNPFVKRQPFNLSMLALLVAGILVGLFSALYPIATVILIITTSILLFSIQKYELSVMMFIIFCVLIPKSGVQIGAFPFSVFLILLPFVVISYVFNVLMKKVPIEKDSSKQIFLTLAFLTLGGISLVSGIGLSQIGVWFLPLFIPMLIPLFLSASIRDKYQLIKYVNLVRIMVFSLTAYGLLQSIFGLQETSIPGLTVNYTQFYAADNVFALKNNVTSVGMKIVGTYQNGNLFGNLYALTLPLLIISILESKGIGKLLNFIFIALSCTIGVLTLSRAALLGMIVGVVSLVLMLKKGRLFLILTFLSILGYFIIINNLIAERVFTFGGASGRMGQLEIYLLALSNMDLATWLGNVLLGAGFTGNFQDFIAIDSSFVLLFQQSGVMGLTIYFFMPFYALLKARPYIRAGIREKNYTGVALAAGIVGSMANMLGDHLLYLPPSGENFWLFVALLLIWTRLINCDYS